MNLIRDIRELAVVMFEVKKAFQGSNVDFAVSMVSCAVTINAHDDIDDDIILKMVMESAMNSLAVAHARKQGAVDGGRVH